MASQSNRKFDAPPTLGEAVAQRIRQDILSGDLPPGAPIRDAELASILGVSITPVREAVAVLISEGLIEVLSNKRRRVKILTQRVAQELMDVVLLLIGAGLERMPKDPRERTTVAERCRDFARDMQQGDRPSAELSFQRFVRVLLEAARNHELIAMAEPIVPRAIGLIRLYPSEHLYDLWAQTFENVAALLTEDTDKAATLVRKFTRDLLDAMAQDRPLTAEVNQAGFSESW